MKKSIWIWLKSYNNFSKGDRNAIIIICVLLLLTVIANIIVRNIPMKSEYNYFEYEQFLNKLESRKSNINNVKTLFAFDPNTISDKLLDSLNIPNQIKRNILSYRKAGGKFLSHESIQKIYGMNDSIYNTIKDYIIFSKKLDTKPKIEDNTSRHYSGYFDPNIADIEQLIEFGFNRFQASNVIEYKKKSGVFKTKSDLLKIYGIDSVFYKTVENHIQINYTEKSTTVNIQSALIQIELNSADSTDLMKLNGIGSVFANRILKYRDLLGGFYSATQLLEVYGFSNESFQKIQGSVSVDTLLINKIRLNFAEYKELIRHPYFSKKQVESIIRYRQKNGSYSEVFQIKVNELVDSETYSRIRHYLTCR